MKLCSILIDGNPCVGAKTDAGIVNLTVLGFPASMNDIISGGGEMLSRISDTLWGAPALDEQSVTFLPVTEPKKIICKGFNYKNHAEEICHNAPEHPILFSKFNDTLSAHGAYVTLPPWQKHYDHEGELVIVIGSPAYNVSVEDAEAHIFGYTCGNDLSARDSQFLSSQWLSGKSFPGFAPAGPYIITRDCFDPCAGHALSCEVNGVTVQSGNTADMIFTCNEIVSAASRFFPLSPGDLIFTGTPEGVIMGRPEGQRDWLKPGDVVKVTIEGIGTLETYLS